MAKTNKNKKQNNKKQKKGVTMRARSALDPAAAAYARLLSDPCHAPLCHPTYSGTEGGYLLRADSFQSFGTGATETSGYFHWAPGLIISSNEGLLTVGVATSGTAAPPVASGSFMPSESFLRSNAAAFRCVAACLKVTYAGSEQNRSGRVHYGQTTSGMIQGLTSYTPDQVAQTLPAYERTPAGCIELVWKPNDADQLFSKPGTATASDSAKNNKLASLTVAFAGLPAGVGLTFHMTSVYEWQPNTGLGIANPNLSKSPSSNTLDDVVNYLIARGETFLRSTAATAGRTIGAGALSAAYGLMAPGGGLRNRRIMG